MADTYNPIYGATLATKCWDCKNYPFGETFGADAGSATCTDGSISIDCNGPNGPGYMGTPMTGVYPGGYVWDGDQNQCVKCPAGTYQNGLNVCTPW